MVSAALHRRAPWGAQPVAAAIVSIGLVIGFIRRRSVALPGLAGAGLVAWGASQVYVPAGWILGGLFLLLADRQIKLRPQGE